MGQKETKTTQITKKYNGPVLEKSFQDFIDILNKQEKIRLFVDGPPGMGHQASSVRILRTLTAKPQEPDFGYAYQGVVEVYYQMRPDGENTLDKLFLLLPELESKSSGKINNAIVELIEYNAISPPSDTVEFGFTGGADNYPDEDKSPNFVETLNVNYFLRLQPYKWMQPQQVQRKEGELISFSEVEETGKETFWNRAYYQPAPTLPEEIWKIYLNSSNIVLRERARILQWLTQEAQKGVYDLLFVYGVRSKACPMKPQDPADALVTIIVGVLQWQWDQEKKPWKRSKSAIIVNLDTFVFNTNDTYPSLNYIMEVLKGGSVNAQIKDYKNDNQVQGSRKEYFDEYLKAKDRVKCQDGGDLDTVQEGVKWLDNFRDRVLFLQLGSVPPLLFDYVYLQSTLPRVFEGMGTANLALSIGEWYFHVQRGDAEGVWYPSTTLGTDPPPEAWNFQTSANYISQSLDFASALGFPKYIEVESGTNLDRVGSWRIGTFMQGFYNEPPSKQPLKDYLKAVKTFYSDPNQGKLHIAINYLNNLVTEQKLTALDLGEEISTLAQLYETLDQEIQATGKVKLTPGVLQKLPGIGTYYNDLASALNTEIVLDPAKLERNPDEELKWIKLSGNTTAPLGPTDSDSPVAAQLEFTAPYGKIRLSATYTESSNYVLQNIPWIPVSDPFLQLILTDGLPVVGAIGATITGIDLQISFRFPAVDNLWLLTGTFKEPLGLASLFQVMGGVNLLQIFEGPFKTLTALKATQLQLLYDTEHKQLQSIAATAATTEKVKLFGNLLLDSLQTTLTVVSPADLRARTTRVNIVGQFKIGEQADAGLIQVGASFPGLALNGQLISGIIRLEALLGIFLPDVPLELPSVPSIDAFFFSYNVKSGDYSVSCQFNIDWPIIINGTQIFNIDSLAFLVSGAGENRQGFVMGSVTILPDDPDVNLGFTVSATYQGKNRGWTFEGKETSGQIPLGKLISKYLGWETDQTYGIDGLSLTVSTADNSWVFTGKTAEPWQVPFIPSLSVQAFLTAGYNSDKGNASFFIAVAKSTVLLALDNSVAGSFARLETDWTWEKSIEIKIWFDYNPQVKSFGFTLPALRLEATVRQNTEQDWIGMLKFTESTTLGSIIELMVGWATGSQFSLGSPWNLLDSIPLNNLSLIWNFTKKQVSFNIDIGPIEMGFARIDSINVAYKSNQPNKDDNGVQIELVGTFRWQADPSKPLGWDASKPETTPAPNGQGNKYLDLRLLALGQHVTLPCFANANSVQEAIACMKQLPEPDKKDIMVPPVTLDANSSWLIGMDFGILRFGGDQKPIGGGGDSPGGTALVSLAQGQAAPVGYFITMQIVFNDPSLYALRIALDGDAAKVLKGLDFQILYKKISDSVGLYKAEIALPDAMRFIRTGQLNITLPVFGIEYYTNGDFQIDFGFPWKADFSRSLTFQTLIWTPIGVPIPVMGSLGVYVGKLSSATTNKVPKIDNGTFNPVLVFGFGIQFGIGYTFEAGILKAGFSLTAVAILEGVVAKFNPYLLTDGSRSIDQVESAYYFWLHGTIGIIGKLFGSVDFTVIKADVNVDIRILASFTFAPYEPIELNLMASVEIEVSVRVDLGLFKIKVSFSFSAKISQTVTIPAIGGNPPWHVVQGETALFMLVRRQRRRILVKPETLLAIAADTPLNWKNLKSAEKPVKLQGYMTLGLTMAGDTATQLSEQLACYVAMMFIDSVAPPQEDRTSGMSKAYGATADTSFELLAKMILRWAVAALQPAPVTADEVDNIVVTDLQLQRLLNALNNPDQPTPIPSLDIESFMSGQFDFQVEGPTTAKEPNATYFPVAPAMALNLPKYGEDYAALSYAFGEYNKTSSDYLYHLRAYFNQLTVKVQEETTQAVSAFALEDSDGESLGSFIFSDYFLMICRQMLQSALDSLREFKYFLQGGNTPNDIINWINSNAGLSGDLLYQIEELFTDNASVPLSAGKPLLIQGATYVVQANDTFDSIAANSLFSTGFDGAALAALNADTDNTLAAGVVIHYPGKDPYPTKPGQSLQKVAAAIGVEFADLIKNGGIASLAKLPLPVATYKLPGFTYNTLAGDTLRSVAAKFRIDQAMLAAADANGAVADLFDKSASSTLDIANLNQFKVGELLKEIQAGQGLQHLAGMTSRYYMAGLRLPTDGITPQKKGMWVTGDSPSNYKLPAFAGLYALTGQQFAIPTLNGTDDFNVNFVSGGLKWLNFVNGDPTKLQISIKPNTVDTRQIDLVKGFATKTRLDTGLTYLGLRGMFNTKAATYAFNAEIAWNAASAFNMPYGGKPPGIPNMQLWRLPDPLLALPDLSTRKVNPRMAMKVGEYGEAVRAMTNRDLNYYGYASLIEFTVKKVPVINASPSTKTTYEVTGADGSSARVLERIVGEIGNNNDAIQTLILAYPADPNGTTSQGIQTDNADALTLGLAKVNLSTETRPDSGSSFDLLLVKGGGEGMTLLNEKTDFVRLLWEASITRAGGYFLYYFNQDNGGGFPDRVFNDKQEALLSLIVVYSRPTDTTLQNTIGNYMNTLVTGEAFNDKNAMLFAESDPNPGVTIPSTAKQRLAEIAYAYFENVSQVAADNATLKLRSGLKLIVSEGTYIVGQDSPGGDLSGIAKHFGTTPQAIKDANPKIAVWPDTLAQYTALYLPVLAIEVGTSNGGETLGDLAKYYGMNLTALANHNKDVAGIFSEGQPIKISGGPVITASTVPQGNVTVEAIRPEPPEIPGTPTGDDYGKTFLLNMYGLLSYQVAGNPYFKGSKLGLPASPSAKPEDDGNASKIRAPKALVEGDDWLFRLAVPYNPFSLQTYGAESDLPDPNNSPYKGLGDLLQIDFAWQDLYGNRLITNLSNPAANDKTPLNKSPILTGYNDAIIGLRQWPSVASTYEIVDDSGTPTIKLYLSFDASVYQGLISAKITGNTAVDAVFTDALDEASAETASNYALDNGIKIQSAVLGADKHTVTLAVDQIPADVEIILSVANISNADKTQTFHGLAKFHNPENPAESTSTLLQKAKGDLQTYTNLWYQLTDPYGIGYTVTTSLVTGNFTLDSVQASDLVQKWLASIWKFIKDRAQGGVSVPKPAASHLLGFGIDETKLNPEEIYKLDLAFMLERTGGAIMGEMETTGGIKSVSTPISPCAGTASKTVSSLQTFAQNFETALAKVGVYTLKIATGIDREESLSGAGGNDLWVVRLGQQTSIAYQINNKNKPLLFAPRPVSNKLENRDQVPIYDFNPQTGIDFSAPSRRLAFTGIDMDLWCQQFFSTVDGTLSSEFTAAIQLVDHHQNKTYLQGMLDNKKALAGITKDWMIPVFDDEPAGSTAGIQEAFYQQLLVKLGNAYTVKAGVEYSATVEAGAFKLLFINLDGDNNLVLLFTSDIDNATAEDTSNYTISGGLTVLSATLNAQNPQIVTLKLSGGVPVVGETQVEIAPSYVDGRHTQISGSRTMAVQPGSAATPEIYGNITQNFKFLGVAIDETDKAKLYLYFSGTLDKTRAEDAQNYTVSDNLKINSATLNADTPEIVSLTLSGDAIVGQTSVTISKTFTNLVGQTILCPLAQTVNLKVDTSHLTKGINITSAKLNLKNSDAVPLPFLLSAPQLVRDDSGAVLSYIDLDTTYKGNAVEHQIGSLPNVPDYRASTWLNFLNGSNALDADLGAVKVPMILRSFPASPAMVNQRGEASKPILDGGISNILEWNYTINYSQTVHYPQDELYFTVNFNVANGITALATFEDAFNQLAEFITVYPDVEKVFLEKLLKIDATTTDPSEFKDAATALESFNAMVGRIVDAAEGNGLRIAGFGAPRLSTAVEPYKFQLKEGSGTVRTETSALVITLFGKPPIGIGDPTVTIPGYTTTPYTGTCNGDFCFYFEDASGTPLKAAVGQGIGPRAVKLPNMNILARQDVDTTVELKRNVDLVPGKTTASHFIYTTGEVGFGNPYYPLIEYNQVISIAATGGGGNPQNAPLSEHLTKLFNELLKENSQDILSFLMTNTYAYQSNPSLDGIDLPVIMQPMQSFNVKEPSADNGNKTVAEMIESWSGSILTWFRDHQTQTQGGILHFDLTIFSNLTQQPIPLLRLNSLILELKYVTNIPKTNA